MSAAKAEVFRKLNTEGNLLLPHAWDAASARVFEVASVVFRSALTPEHAERAGCPARLGWCRGAVDLGAMGGKPYPPQ